MHPILTRDTLSYAYDAVIVDLWGVIHDGTHLYPHALSSLTSLKRAGLTVILLSNAPRRAHKARQNLDTLGITPDLYDHLLTSGELAYLRFKHQPQWLGTKYYYLGPSKDEDVLSALSDYERVTAPSDADFILNTGFEYDFQPVEEMLPTLTRLAALSLPLVCINPDHTVVKRDGTSMLCAGVVAEHYEALGGSVHYFGKPYQAVYEHALSLLANPDPARVLAIGDTIATDILGANRAGMDAMLITGGVLAVAYPQGLDNDTIDALCHAAGAQARYIASLFNV